MRRRTEREWILLLAVSALVAACGTKDPRGAPRAPGGQDVVEVGAEPVDCDAYADRALRVRAESREAFRAALGEPDSVATMTLPNRHDPAVTDTIVALHFPGLSAVIWKPGYEDARDLLDHVEVRGNRHLRWPSLGVGARVEDIVAALGEPAERSAGRLVYRCGSDEAAVEPLVFALEAGTVARVQFNRYVD